MKTSRDYISPQKAFSWLGKEIPSHIKYDPNIKKGNGADYEIIRSHKHDGTGMFLTMLMGEVLKNLDDKSSCYLKDSQENVIDREYIVGDIKLATVIGFLDINGHRMFGQRERARIAVKCINKYQNNESNKR